MPISSLGAYSDYDQIKMYPPDESKTTFITEDANFCYKVMPFSLKNIDATYRRLMDKVFKDLLRKNIKLYVDDMLVKSSDPNDHPKNLAEIFAELQRHNMRLNPEKYVFGVGGGKFLGFMVTCKGIEANLDKCEAIITMRNPQNLKEV